MSPLQVLPPRAVEVLACPVCGAALAALPGDAGLRCAGGHSFDRARQGHVTLLAPGSRPPSGDSAEMVADRGTFLDAGHFAGVTAALAAAVLCDGAPPRTVLDLGGGTGHHLAAVLDDLPDAVGVVLDSSRYAARRAARVHPRALAVVADTWRRLPVRDAVLDRVVVAFAPRNGPACCGRTGASSSSPLLLTTCTSWSGRWGSCAWTPTSRPGWRPPSSPTSTEWRPRGTGRCSHWTGRPS
jgi:23S rRNA (guanine745-N1)-methyltransferase